MTLSIAPEVLPVTVPFLCIQPLVENAVRHGIEGQEEGHVTITAHDQGPDCVIEVEDDGAGMEPEVADRVFDPYYTTRAKVGGTGLGLSISKSLVERLGGTINVQSEKGVGTTFSFSVNVTLVPEETKETLEEEG